MRKSRIMPILEEEPAFKKQLMEYMLDYYHTVVRTPMLKFKLRIESTHCKSQEKDKVVHKINEFILQKQIEYE